MNDKFYKSIKNNLENRPEPTFQESAWKRMEKQLAESTQVDKPSSARWSKSWWLPLLLLLFLGMAGSNFWFYQQLQVKKGTVLMQRDTIYRSQIIIQTDTIYQTKVIYKSIVKSKDEVNQPTNLADPINPFNISTLTNFVTHKAAFNPVNGFSVQNGLPYLKGNRFGLENISLNHFSLNNNKQKFPFDEDNILIINDAPKGDKESATTLNNLLLGPLDTIQTLAIPRINWTNNRPIFPIYQPVVKRKKTVRQQLYQMRPKSFSLALKGGYANAVNAQLDNIGSYTFGVDANISFSQNFRLWSEVSFLQLKYISPIIDERFGVPTITPPTDNFVFKQAEVLQPSYQFGVGLQYLLSTRNKFKPYLGVGYGVMALVPYEVTYEFNDPLTGIDLTLEQVINRNNLLKGQLLLKAGLEYEFNQHWSWQLEGNYRISKGNIGLNAPNVLGIKTGLRYQF